MFLRPGTLEPALHRKAVPTTAERVTLGSTVPAAQILARRGTPGVGFVGSCLNQSDALAVPRPLSRGPGQAKATVSTGLWELLRALL